MVRTLSELKALFASRDIPTEQAFVDLIDTLSGILPADETVTPAMMQAGANKTLLRTNASGDVEWALQDLSLLQNSFVCEDTTNTNDYELDLDPLPATYAELHNKPIFLRVTNPNSGAVTIAIKGDANTKVLETVEKQAVPAGLLKANQMFLCSYYQPDDKFYILAILGDTEPIGPAGGSLTGTYPNPTLAPEVVDTPELVDEAVETAKLADDAVNKDKLGVTGTEAANSVLGLIDPGGGLELTWLPRVLRKTTIAQTSHGFVVGDVLRRSGSVFVKSQGDTIGNSEAAGVVTTVVDTHHFEITFSGPADIGTGRYASMKAGAYYYVDAATAGDVVESAPSVARPVWVCMEENTGRIYINPQATIPAASQPQWTHYTTPGSGQITGLAADTLYLVCVIAGGGLSGTSTHITSVNDGVDNYLGGPGGKGGRALGYVKSSPTGTIDYVVGNAAESSSVTSTTGDTDYDGITALPGGTGGNAYTDDDTNPGDSHGAAGTDGAVTGPGPSILLEGIVFPSHYGQGGIADEAELGEVGVGQNAGTAGMVMILTI